MNNDDVKIPEISDICEHIFCTIHILKCWGILVNRQNIEKIIYNNLGRYGR